MWQSATHDDYRRIFHKLRRLGVRLEFSKHRGVTVIGFEGKRLLKESGGKYYISTRSNPKVIENLGFEYSQALDYKDKRWQKQIRRKLARRIKKMKRNPTPLLRNLRGEATFLLQQLGREKAIQVARTMTGDSRRNAILIRMIERSGVHKLRKRPVRKTMYDKLLEEFPPVSPMEARGFILDNGECLNLGQYDDHRIINCVYPDSTKAEQRYGSRYGAFVNLCKKYNMIRWTPESKMCEVFVEPTSSQLSAMRELAENGMLKEIEVHPPRRSSAILEAEDADTLVAGVEAVYGR